MNEFKIGIKITKFTTTFKIHARERHFENLRSGFEIHKITCVKKIHENFVRINIHEICEHY